MTADGFSLGPVGSSADSGDDAPLRLPNPPPRSSRKPADAAASAPRSTTHPPLTGTAGRRPSPPPSTHDEPTAAVAPHRRRRRTAADDLETATFVVAPHHREQIRRGAFEARLYQWAWLSQVVLARCPQVAAPVRVPRPTGPGQRPATIHYTVNLTPAARRALVDAAARWTDGDRSRLLRHLLDTEAAAGS